MWRSAMPGQRVYGAGNKKCPRNLEDIAPGPRRPPATHAMDTRISCCWLITERTWDGETRPLLTMQGPFHSALEILMDRWVATWVQPYYKASFAHEPRGCADSMLNLVNMYWPDRRRALPDARGDSVHRRVHGLFNCFKPLVTLSVDGEHQKLLLGDEWDKNPCQCELSLRGAKEAVLESRGAPGQAARKEELVGTYRLTLTKMPMLCKPFLVRLDLLPPEMMARLDEELPPSWDARGWTRYREMDRRRCSCCRESYRRLGEDTCFLCERDRRPPSPRRSPSPRRTPSPPYSPRYSRRMSPSPRRSPSPRPRKRHRPMESFRSDPSSSSDEEPT